MNWIYLLYFILYLHECFAYMYIYIPVMCLVPTSGQKIS